MRLRPALALGLLLVSCDAPSGKNPAKGTATYRGSNFRCSHPADWKVVVGHDDPGKASVEFDFPGPGFATVIVFQPENRSAFERYTQIASKKFPGIHEKDYPSQKVSTVSVCEKAKLGSLDALKTTFSIFVAPNHRKCVFTYVDLTRPEMVALVDVFDEGTTLSTAITASLEQLIGSITARRSTDEPAASAEGEKPAD